MKLPMFILVGPAFVWTQRPYRDHLLYGFWPNGGDFGCDCDFGYWSAKKFRKWIEYYKESSWCATEKDDFERRDYVLKALVRTFRLSHPRAYKYWSKDNRNLARRCEVAHGVQ